MSFKKTISLGFIILFLTTTGMYGMWDSMCSGASALAHTCNVLSNPIRSLTAFAMSTCKDIKKHNELFLEDPSNFWQVYGKNLPFYLRAYYIRKIMQKPGLMAKLYKTLSHSIDGGDTGFYNPFSFDTMVASLMLMNYEGATSIRRSEAWQMYLDRKSIFDVLGAPQEYQADTFTAKHVKQYRREILNTLSEFSISSVAKNLFLQALRIQYDAWHHQNRVCLFHGRMPEWEYASDIYKQIYNLTRSPDQQVGEDYTFLRFDDSKRESKVNKGLNDTDVLFMNAALFGNATNPGSSTAHYILMGIDQSDGPARRNFTAEYFFQQFNLSLYYKKYEAEFKKLERMHKVANSDRIGNLLIISVDSKDLDRVKILHGNGKSLRDTIKGGYIDDQTEYLLDMDKDYLLDPYNGPRIYSLNGSDPEKFAAYQTARDQLFATIRADMALDRGGYHV